jgi:hypothetical protein
MVFAQTANQYHLLFGMWNNPEEVLINKVAGHSRNHVIGVFVYRCTILNKPWSINNFRSLRCDAGRTNGVYRKSHHDDDGEQQHEPAKQLWQIKTQKNKILFSTSLRFYSFVLQNY